MSSDLPIPRQDRPADRPEPPSVEPREPAAGAGTTADGASVVSWGEPPRTSRRTGMALGRLGRDGRLVPVVALLGAAAVLGSLFTDWILTSMPVDGNPTANRVELASGVADLKALGTGYLVGVFGVIGCVALVLFGSPGVRHNARVLGLACTGLVFGLLAAISGSLDEFSDIWSVYGELEGLTNTYGRGVVLAYLGLGALGLALLLAGRFVPQPLTGPTSAGPSGATTAPVDPATAEESDWPWRRRRAASPAELDNDDDRSAPIDLTVTPTKPFTR